MQNLKLPIAPEYWHDTFSIYVQAITIFILTLVTYKQKKINGKTQSNDPEKDERNPD